MTKGPLTPAFLGRARRSRDGLLESCACCGGPPTTPTPMGISSLCDGKSRDGVALGLCADKAYLFLCLRCCVFSTYSGKNLWHWRRLLNPIWSQLGPFPPPTYPLLFTHCRITCESRSLCSDSVHVSKETKWGELNRFCCRHFLLNFDLGDTKWSNLLKVGRNGYQVFQIRTIDKLLRYKVPKLQQSKVPQSPHLPSTWQNDGVKAQQVSFVPRICAN